MSRDVQESATAATRPTRIWWQSFVDPSQNEPYLRRLVEYLHEIAEPGTTVEVHGMSPPDRGFGRLTELRCSVIAVDNALRAEEEGYDAYAMGHFQDPGLYAARSAVRIPVVGLGEASLHWAAQLGRHIALVSIDPVFERWHAEQAELYGLRERVTEIVGMGAIVEDFAPAFAGDEQAYARLLARFRELVEPLVARGADVVIPAGALPALLLAREHGLELGGAPVVNAVAVTLKATEMAVRLARLTGLGPSRGPSFALAPEQAREDFRRLARGPSA
ncbi:MAG TPA: aspartate/glutamate racemase family protein [Gaiellaceae bacterium]|jgi:Asp/Glu/hydantoin racemase